MTSTLIGSGLVVLALVLVLFAAVGVSAISWPDQRSDAEAVVRGVGAGLPTLLILGLVTARLGVFNRLLLVPVVVFALVGMRRINQTGFRYRYNPYVAAAVGVAGLGIWLRRNPVYFLGDWTDFGEYVNRGNSVADGGSPGGYFPPLTEIVVSLGHLGFSEQLAVWIFPVLGMLTATLVAAVAHQLTGSMNAALLAGLLFAIHPVAVWFGRLPTSESLYALLSLIAVFQIIEVSRGGPTWILAVTVFAMVVTRPNGVLFVVPFLAVVVVGLLSQGTDRSWNAGILPFMVGWGSGLLWLLNFGYSRGVLVNVSAFSGIDTAGLASTVTTVWFQAALVGVIALAAFGLVTGAAKLPRSPLVAEFLVAAALFGSAAVVVMANRVWILRDGLSSIGIVTCLLAVVGGAVIWWRSRLELGPLAAIIAPGVMWSTVFAIQFTMPLPHYVYLYWERYLFPNVVVALVILAGCAAASLDSHRSGRTRVAFAAVLLVAASTAVIDGFERDLRIQHHRQFHGEGYYEALEQVADQLPPDAVVSYEGVAPEVIWDQYYFFFPNTYRILANPLAATFGVTFNNLPQNPSGPDPLTTVPGATHRLVVALANDETAGQPAVGIPLSILPRDSVEFDQWNEWELFVRVEAL